LGTEHGATGPAVPAGGAAGVDWGATLAKLAVQRPGEPTELRLLPVSDAPACLEALSKLDADCIGVTGGGARRLLRALAGARAVGEFEAMAAGAAALLAEAGQPSGQHLLVSLGTGTSVLRVDGDSVTRIGGTALGGGTLLGLAAGLTGIDDYERVVALAQQGARSTVDLLVSDVYGDGESPVPGSFIAASFGRLPRRLAAGERIADADVAQALIGLLAENVARVCAGLATAAGLSRIVYVGSTLRNNPMLVGGLALLTRALGHEPLFPARGEFAGALGALRLASDAAIWRRPADRRPRDG
jgi:type II pantothenate kinase